MSVLGEEIVLGVSDFVTVFNQTLELAYPSVSIVGELANFRVSRNRWVYFDLKDELASIKFFGTVYNLPGPLEDGLLLKVSGAPRLHPQFGFSINIQTIQPVGEGSLKRAALLLEQKLTTEGLFDPSRKRPLPYPPQSIGLVSSAQSAAYADFIKILSQRWAGIDIQLADVQVQGETAPAQIVRAIEYFNNLAKLPEVLVISRGGGSAEDLAVFNTEKVTRAIAASRVPTLVAIGHEIDISLAELAADKRASTPSNAAELLVPDKRHEGIRLEEIQKSLGHSLANLVTVGQANVSQLFLQLNQNITQYLMHSKESLSTNRNLLNVLNPASVLKRGYAIVRQQGKVVSRARQLNKNEYLSVQISDAIIRARAEKVII